MKDFLSKAVMVAMALLATTGFVACGDDDDDDNAVNGGSGSGSSAVSSLRVTKVGEWAMEYDGSGRLVSIGDNYGFKTVINGNKMLLESEGVQINFATLSFNGNGYISKIELKFDEEYSGLSEIQSTVYNLSYNGDGQLAKGTASGNGSYYEEDYGRVTYTGTATFTCNYSNGNLMSFNIDSKESGTRGGQSYSLTTNIKAVFDYGNQENKFRQFSFYVADEIGLLGDFSGPIACAGLLGKGTALLPTGFTVTETENENGEVESYNDTSKLTFTLNEDGTIMSEARDNNSPKVYVYGTSGTRSFTQEQSQNVRSLLNVLPRMFRRH